MYCICPCACTREDENFFPTVAKGLYDWEKVHDLGLQRPQGLHVSEVYTAQEGAERYCNGAVPFLLGGTLYLMWQSSHEDEDSGDTHLMYAISEDLGESWSSPMRLCPQNETSTEKDEYFYTSGGWAGKGDTIVAFVNRWKKDRQKEGGEAFFLESSDGTLWSAPGPVLMGDGTPMKGVIEQDIHALPSGRKGKGSLYVTGVHLSPGLHLCPVYTEDPSGRSGWKRGVFPSDESGQQSREMEPSFYYRRRAGKDIQWVMLSRDQHSSFRKLYSVSSDCGRTWSESRESGIPDSRSKQSCGNLPDGTVYSIGNPSTSKDRTVLALALSSDGTLFDRAFLLEGGGPSLPPRVYDGRAKTIGYSYPKACVGGGYLFVGYSVNKERIRVGRIPLRSLVRQ